MIFLKSLQATDGRNQIGLRRFLPTLKKFLQPKRASFCIPSDNPGRLRIKNATRLYIIWHFLYRSYPTRISNTISTMYKTNLSVALILWAGLELFLLSTYLKAWLCFIDSQQLILNQVPSLTVFFKDWGSKQSKYVIVFPNNITTKSQLKTFPPHCVIHAVK